ncbi:hypothetical protein [Campylobacter gracilis]|uniref:Uncharacterized protein n=1 Tax=Campylobacter gracilis RM3268 TaxID=553220 RepID=C8PFV7_9BACT|nr:hypothetical protein [Campylobacter gracilis]EEV17995.1 hypothetical protein CAMGR0001_0749 [Campylobacter gracilis RM3268]UEB45121.1 hypothetical protein LK410_09015 [Campylobacter gracilis]
MLIYCALNAAFALLGLALCGSGFFGTGSFGVQALAWLLSLEAGFLGAFGAVYFSFRAYRNKIEDELRAGKYDEILRQSPKNSSDFISGKTSANDTNSASCGGENRGGTGGSDEISYSEVYGGEILKSESFRGVNLGAEISNAQNSKGAVNFTSGDSCVENDDSHALYDETAAECAANSAANINFTHSSNLDAECDKIATGECDINSTESSRDETSACGITALEHTAADKFNMKDGATCSDSYGGINDEASDSSQGGIGARCGDLKNVASSDLGGGLDSSERSDGADRSNHSDGTDSGNRGGDVDSGKPGDGTSDFGGGIDGPRDGSNDDFDGADGSIDGWDDECERGEVRSNFAGAFFSPFKILSYAALVAAIYLLAKLSLLNPLAIILGVAIIPLGTMIVAFADKDAR